MFDCAESDSVRISLWKAIWSQEDILVNVLLEWNTNCTGFHNSLAKLGGRVVVCFGGFPFCERIERYNRLALSYMSPPMQRSVDKAFE